MTDRARFLRRVIPGHGGCLVWVGARSRTGSYGITWFGLKTTRAHRAAWELAYGPVPPRLHVLHSCDCRWCVNPVHLFLGSQRENMRDMARKGRGARKSGRFPFGVQLLKGGRYEASFRVDRKRICLGSFVTMEQAQAVALAAKRLALGEAK